MSLSLTPQLIAILKAAGCTFVRHGKGDHDIWYSPISDRRFVVDQQFQIQNLKMSWP